MTTFSFWYPGDDILMWSVNIAMQVTVVSALSLLVARWVAVNHSARYWILCCSLFLTLLSPLTVIVTESASWNLVSLSPSEASAPTDNEAVTPLAPAGRDEAIAGSGRLEGELSEQPPLPAEPRWEFGSNIQQRIPKVNSMETSVGQRSAGSDAVADEQAEQMLIGAASLEAILRKLVSLLLWLWLAGSIVCLIRLVRAWVALSNALRNAAPVTADVVYEIVSECREIFGTADVPSIVRTSMFKSPISAGIWRPRVVLPDGLVQQVTLQELREVMVHELAHVYRRDPVVVLLQNVATAMYWWHPLVRSLNRQLAFARETICDNHVLATTDAISYSRTLLRLSELVQRDEYLPASAGLFERNLTLEARVAGLLDERRNRTTRLGIDDAGLLMAVAAALVAMCGLVRIGLATQIDGARTTDGYYRAAPERFPAIAVAVAGTPTKKVATDETAGARRSQVADDEQPAKTHEPEIQQTDLFSGGYSIYPGLMKLPAVQRELQLDETQMKAIDEARGFMAAGKFRQPKNQLWNILSEVQRRRLMELERQYVDTEAPWLIFYLREDISELLNLSTEQVDTLKAILATERREQAFMNEDFRKRAIEGQDFLYLVTDYQFRFRIARPVVLRRRILMALTLEQRKHWELLQGIPFRF